MAPGSRGVGAVFVHFSGEDSGQTGDAIGEPRVPRRSWSRYLSNAPGLADQLVSEQERLCARRRLSLMSDFRRSWYRRKACAAYFCKVPGFAGIRAWTCEIWPLRTEATGSVFGPFGGTVFRSGFRLDPVNSWRSESSTSCMNVSSFQRASGLRINLLRVRKTLRASVATSDRKVPEFSAKALFRRPVFTRVALHRGELGFARYDLANRGRWNVPYAKGTPIRRSVFAYALYEMSDQGSGSGGPSPVLIALRKGKAAELDAEAAGLASSAASAFFPACDAPSPTARVPTRSTGIPPSRFEEAEDLRGIPLSAGILLPEDYAAPGFQISSPWWHSTALSLSPLRLRYRIRPLPDGPPWLIRLLRSVVVRILPRALVEVDGLTFVRLLEIARPRGDFWVIADPADRIVGKKLFYLRIQLSERISCPTVPTPIVRYVPEILTPLREYDWGALDIWILHPGLAPLSLVGQIASFPRLLAVSLAMGLGLDLRAIDRPYTPMEAVELSRLRIWIRISRVLGALDGREGVEAYPDLDSSRTCPTRSGLSGFSLGSLDVSSRGGDGPCAGGVDPGVGGDGADAGGDGTDAGGFGPGAEGLGFPGCGTGYSCCDHPEIRGAASRVVPWDLPVRHFWVIFAFLDFLVELGFRGRFLTFKSGSRLLGHPAGGRSILIMSYRTSPYKIVPDSIFDLRADFRVSGRIPGRQAGIFDHQTAQDFPHRMTMPTSWGSLASSPPFMRLRVDRGLLEAFASFWDPTHCCFSIGEVDLVPTLEEYAGLLQLDSPFQRDSGHTHSGVLGQTECLEKVLGFDFTAVLRPEILRPEETWRKANISLDLLTKYFSRSDFPVELARDFIAGKKGWKKFRINAFKIAFAGIFLFPTSAGRIDLGVIPLVFSEGRSIIPAILCETVRSLSYCTSTSFRRQGEGYRLPMFCTQLLHREFPVDSLSFCILSQRPDSTSRLALEWVGLEGYLGGQQCGCPGLIVPSSMECLFLGCGVVQATIPALLFAPLQDSRLSGEGRLSEVVLIEDGSPGDSSVTSDFVEWREGWTPFFTLRPTVRPGASYSLVSRFLRVSAFHWASEREESAARVESMRSTLHHKQCGGGEPSPRLGGPAGGDLGLRLREQLETEQVERTRVQDELDSLRSYTSGLWVQISVLQGDNGVLQTELDLVHDALESNASWLNQEGFPVVTALHQINQVMDSLGARARACLGGA
uniref:DUF7745 domain-containing protein n=1 Tax=Fagus sylvatica TaxID=28930 RepID=A0A2N9IU49_FAGSY